MSISDIGEKEKITRLNILHRRTLKMDYSDHKHKNDNDIFGLKDRLSRKNFDRNQVEKNIDAKMRVNSI
jgi:hypothetical protein